MTLRHSTKTASNSLHEYADLWVFSKCPDSIYKDKIPYNMEKSKIPEMFHSVDIDYWDEDEEAYLDN